MQVISRDPTIPKTFVDTVQAWADRLHVPALLIYIDQRRGPVTDKLAACEVNVTLNRADIWFHESIVNDTDTEINNERIVVHELLHITAAGLDALVESVIKSSPEQVKDLWNREREREIDMLSHIILELSGQ